MITAHAGDHREEEGEGDELLDGVLEEADDHRQGEHRGQVHDHPGQTLADCEAGGREDTVLLGEAREVIHVLGGLLRNHIDHVVDRDHAEHRAVDVRDRDRQQVVAGDQPCHLLLVRLGLYAGGHLDGQVAAG